MHIGKQNTNCCPDQKTGNEKMLSTNSEKYLGDILSCDGKVDANIEDRYNKGFGIVNQIVSILKEISFGEFYFEMSILFRQSMLLNSILCNTDVLYGLTKSHIDKLEREKSFQCQVSTPTEVLFMETNNVHIHHVIMSRRMMYYWNIL